MTPNTLRASLLIAVSLAACEGDQPAATPEDADTSEVSNNDVVDDVTAPPDNAPPVDAAAPVDVAPPLDVATDAPLDAMVDVAVDTGCSSDDACPAAQHCDSTTRACVAGCHSDMGCATSTLDGGAPAMRCDTVFHACVECNTDEHCALGSVCASHRCAPGCTTTRGCPMSATCCSGACVDTSTALAHCGGCGMRCAPASATGACAAGRCAVASCAAGRGDCDGDATNGCEVDTAVTLAHCGGCGTACAPASATGSCVAGRCAIGTCNPGRGDCDASPANGCEVDTRAAVAHCGACGNACGAGQSCAMGACTTLRSCNEIHVALPALPSGAYTIDPDGAAGRAPFSVYCDMTSDGGGWTLCLKADGARTTFLYDAEFWVNDATLNPTSTNLEAAEAKFESFAHVPFSAVRLAFTDAGTTRALVVPTSAQTSLRGVFVSGTYEATTVGRAGWLGLHAMPSLQRNCNREGFNDNVTGYTRVRLGIIGNQEADCGSPDSRIGIGGQDNACATGTANNSVGNSAACDSENGDRDTRVFGYLFVR